MATSLTAGHIFALSALCLACFLPCMFGWFLLWRLAKQSQEAARAAQIAVLSMARTTPAQQIAGLQASEMLEKAKTPREGPPPRRQMPAL